MFKVIESLNYDYIRLPIKPGVKLVPGSIVKISEFEGNVVVDICGSEKDNPFGIVSNRCFGGSHLDFGINAKIYINRMIIDLSRFDRGNSIDIGSSLYCNSKGILTNKKPFKDAILLAKVISPARKEKKHMTILWL